MYDVFMSRVEGFPSVRIQDIIKRTSSGIDLAPSSLDLVGADPYLYTLSNRAVILKEALTGLGDRYDFILIDTPPSMGQFVINCLYAADHIVVTLDSGTFAISGISTLTTIFGDIKEDLGKEIRADMAIVTRWGEGEIPECPLPESEGEKDIFLLLRSFFYKKPEPTPEELKLREEKKEERDRMLAMLEEIKRRFPMVFTVPFSPSVYEAQNHGLPVSHFAPESDAGRAYRTIADEVMKWK
jgi:chromosome partitioning protein